MPAKVVVWLKRLLWLLLIFVVALLSIRIWDSQRGPPLQPWHTYVPEELGAKALDAADWPAYLAHEARLFDAVHARMRKQLDTPMRVPSNRYYEGASMYPGRFAHDWNRSYVLDPAGVPRGAVVLLHGLTDSPYSLRHIARRYREHGYVAVGLRLPAHGTVPGALTKASWREWMAATRLAVREARRRAGDDVPLHIVGYSNGGALAMKYALDAIEDKQLARPDRLLLISPMIGITGTARFAGIAAWPAVFPAFAKAAWLGIEPEYNPFKYNSFPVNGARQSWLVANALRTQMARLNQQGQLSKLAPVLTFQSVVDATVNTRDVLTGLYAQLPANGSEIVLFDVNRNVAFDALLQPGAGNALQRLLPNGPQRYRSTIIANVAPGRAEMVERTTEAGTTTSRERALALRYPPDIFSLSHVALPFPVTDALYGVTPGPEDHFGIHLGAFTPRGERGTLLVGPSAILRLNSNPFFPYLIERTEAVIVPANASQPKAAATADRPVTTP
ncbi:alpha-beta hydrolase superfamily lysophospholipase [Luteimonas cucumeris]|uniref:Alpha-beta hydrolase superfamily lysophospholipase n=1 Tax=Luteimonas cucumeris TaxID=985012 RepID=A0A562L2K3_9GAMM|nr:alpha/beta hydrolase [Luteimonas cucumeris]TWI01862.1 alpha-beta hydrolase superfamily lysophospholipase [Luteimonas cucumeris]